MIKVVIIVSLGLMWFIGTLGSFIHDENVLESHHKDAKLQYFINSENLTNREKYNLAQSICNETFSNQSIYDDKLWATKIPFWGVEGHKKHEINRCEHELLGID